MAHNGRSYFITYEICIWRLCVAEEHYYLHLMPSIFSSYLMIRFTCHRLLWWAGIIRTHWVHCTENWKTICASNKCTTCEYHYYYYYYKVWPNWVSSFSPSPFFGGGGGGVVVVVIVFYSSILIHSCFMMINCNLSFICFHHSLYSYALLRFYHGRSIVVHGPCSECQKTYDNVCIEHFLSICWIKTHAHTQTHAQVHSGGGGSNGHS